MTEPLPNIHQALAAAKKQVGGVGKTERNQQQGWNFRGIDAVLNAVSGPLTDNGIIVVPQLQDYTYETVEVGRNNTKMGHVVVKIKYVFIGPKGDFIESLVAAESMDSGDKAMTKAHSVALRTALIQTLSLPTDEPDPDHDVYERSGSQGGADPLSARARPLSTASRTGTTTPAPKAAESVSDADVERLRKAIGMAADTDTLNSIFKQAGALGALPAETVDPETGVKATIQQLMYDRADAIKSLNGDSSPKGRKTAVAK